VMTSGSRTSEGTPPVAVRDWVAVLGYDECPLWDAMESHAKVVIRDLKERWPGVEEGAIQRDAANARVVLPFSIPAEHRVGGEELLQFLASEWTTLSGEGGSVTLGRAPLERSESVAVG